MKKNIAILFPVSRKMGVFQYGLSVAEGLINYCPDFDYTILYYEEESPKEFLKARNLENIKFLSLDDSHNNFSGKAKFLFNIFLDKPIFTTNKKNREIVKSAKIDLLIIPFPLLFGFENKVPYIVSIPDIMHRYYPGFPEYSFKKRIARDIVYKYCSKHSLMSIVDSQQGIEDLHGFFKIPKEKIKAIPFMPPGYVFEYRNMDLTTAEKLVKKYNLPEKFIFYPAQFWFHKNHLRLIEALAIIKEKKEETVSLVLAGNPGANNDNYRKVKNRIQELGLEKQVFQLGYVSDEEIVALYKKALALVFPTLIGPTSIPPLEAMFLGTPVICSNLFSMPEQLGGAGVLFDPFNPEDMAEKIYSVWKDENLRKNMVEKGKEKIKNMTQENYAKKWIEAVKQVLLK